MAHADRFRALLAHLGLSHPDAAKLLHVSLRTLQNWLSGHHAVPYTAYKLLRLMRYMELPGPSWAGWHFSQGQLVTPEGRTISGKDGAWWSSWCAKRTALASCTGVPMSRLCNGRCLSGGEA